MADVTNERRIVIVGKTGAGKSSLANTIFGEDVFKVYHTITSGTSQCEAETRSVSGRSITLIDTPGLFDTNRSEEEMKPEIVSCITECAPGPHAFLIVLKVERFTDQEQEVMNKIHKYFSEEAFKYATVVLTHGDQLHEGEAIEDLVPMSKPLEDLVKKCGGRCHIVDNKYWKETPKHEYRSNQFQVEELLKTIDKMVTENNGGCYTNEMLQAVEEMKKQEKENIRQESGNMTEVEIRKKAKSRVYTLLTRLAGVGTGVFIGALLGVAVMVGAVITALHSAQMLGPTLAAIGSTAEAPVIIGAAVGTSAAVGAVIGGVRGYHAAEGADTPWEAAKMAAEAVKSDAQSVCSKVKAAVDKMSQPKKKKS